MAIPSHTTVGHQHDVAGHLGHHTNHVAKSQMKELPCHVLALDFVDVSAYRSALQMELHQQSRGCESPYRYATRAPSDSCCSLTKEQYLRFLNSALCHWAFFQSPSTIYPFLEPDVDYKNHHVCRFLFYSPG